MYHPMIRTELRDESARHEHITFCGMVFLLRF